MTSSAFFSASSALASVSLTTAFWESSTIFSLRVASSAFNFNFVLSSFFSLALASIASYWACGSLGSAAAFALYLAADSRLSISYWSSWAFLRCLSASALSVNASTSFFSFAAYSSSVSSSGAVSNFCDKAFASAFNSLNSSIVYGSGMAASAYSAFGISVSFSASASFSLSSSIAATFSFDSLILVSALSSATLAASTSGVTASIRSGSAAEIPSDSFWTNLTPMFFGEWWWWWCLWWCLWFN